MQTTASKCHATLNSAVQTKLAELIQDVAHLLQVVEHASHEIDEAVRLDSTNSERQVAVMARTHQELLSVQARPALQESEIHADFGRIDQSKRDVVLMGI